MLPFSRFGTLRTFFSLLAIPTSLLLAGCDLGERPYPGDFNITFDSVCVSYLMFDDLGDKKPSETQTDSCATGAAIGGTLDYDFEATVWIGQTKNDQLTIQAEGVQITDLLARQSSLTPQADPTNWGPSEDDLIKENDEPVTWDVLVGTSEVVDKDSLVYTYNLPIKSPVLIRLSAEKP